MICSHSWIDPSEPPMSRWPYVPIIGPAPHQMKTGRTYECQNCGERLPIPALGDQLDPRRI